MNLQPVLRLVLPSAATQIARVNMPRFFISSLGWLVLLVAVVRGGEPLNLCTPGASPEAVELYQFLHEISGRHTLAGQHCVPLLGSTRLPAAYKMTGHYPAVFSQDFGFSEPGTWDGINYRQQIVDEAIRRHEEGFIINLMWHAVRPLDDEPVDFKQSIQGRLTEEQWQQLLTPGTELNDRWKSQVDVVAFFLKQLRDAGVPVLWRPYHEMNGDWFWWGGRTGGNGYAKLYRMLYDRLVHFHKLNNLVWIFGGNEVREKVGPYADYFPGHDVVDVLATDVYSTNYAGHDYDDLLALANGKPIALAEVGPLPTVEILKKQPGWAWFTVWGDMAGARQDRAAIVAMLGSEEVLTWDELPWVKIKNPVIHYPVIK
jgi:mannan endo-1,4-beta-mannosidase